MNSRQIGLRLGAAFGVVLLLWFVISYLAFNRIDQINAAREHIEASSRAKVQLAQTAIFYSTQNSRITAETLSMQDRAQIQQTLRVRASNSQKITQLIEQMEASCESGHETRLLANVKQARTAYVTSYLRALHLLLDEDKPDAARVEFVYNTGPAFVAYHEAWRSFERFQLQRMQDENDESGVVYRHTRNLVLLLLTIASVAAAFVAGWATHNVLRLVRSCIAAESRIGRLNADLERRVEERNQELIKTNQLLAAEAEERKKGSEQQRVEVAALRAAANAIVITDRDAVIKWVNPAFCQMTGFSEEEVIGQTPRLLSSGNHPKSFYMGLWEKIKSGAVWQGEIINRRKDGSVYTEEMTITPVQNCEGEINGFIAVKQDVTERKKSENRLRRSEEQFRLLFEKSPLGIILVGTDYRFLRVNEAFCKLTGYSEHELLGTTVSDITFPQDVERDAELSRKLLRGEVGAVKLEKRYNKKGGGIVWAEMAKTLVRDAYGAPTYAVGIIADLTEKKEAARALRSAEEKYRRIFEDAIVGIFQSTREGQFLAANPAMARMLGYASPSELMANCENGTGKFYVNPADSDRLNKLLDEAGVAQNFEAEVYRKDRSKIWLSEHVHVVRKDGIVVCHEGMAEDITERKLLEDQLRQAQKMEAVGRLAGGVAHDFNNALGIIIGYSELLSDRFPPVADEARFLGEIKTAALRGADLTRQLLAFSRKQVIEPTILDLNSIVADTEKMLRRLIGEDVEMCLSQTPELWAVRADRCQIEQVLMNLVVNARDAMPNGGKLTIATANVNLDEAFARANAYVKPGPYVALRVGDTGCGMDDETVAHIFEPFFTTKIAGKGTGLGLSMVYGIVKQSAGYILVDTKLGQGTTFTIYLPQMQKPRVPEGLPELCGAACGGVETILVVEDEAPLRELVRACLEQKGYRVLTADNGETALHLLEADSGHIDLVVSDMIMPGLSGAEFGERLNGLRPHAKIIYMSGYTDDRVALSKTMQRRSKFLQKPFTSDVLLGKVREELDSVRDTSRETIGD